MFRMEKGQRSYPGACGRGWIRVRLRLLELREAHFPRGSSARAEWRGQDRGGPRAARHCTSRPFLAPLTEPHTSSHPETPRETATKPRVRRRRPGVAQADGYAPFSVARSVPAISPHPPSLLWYQMTSAPARHRGCWRTPLPLNRHILPAISRLRALRLYFNHTARCSGSFTLKANTCSSFLLRWCL